MLIRRIAIIGAGPAGRTFAMRCAVAGFDVVLEDVMPSNLRRAQDEYAALDSPEGSGSLRYAATVDDAVREADIVVDFVPDELESKLEIFSLADRMAPPHTILCTPTEVLSITDLASCTYRAELCIALRGPLSLTGSVELVQSRYCSGDVLDRVSELLTSIDMRFTVVDDL